jgi:hypothetical protein
MNNLMKYLTNLFLFLFLIISVNCQDNNKHFERELLLNSDHKILVLENDEDKNGMLNIGHNKIVIYNADSKYRYELTDTKYITDSPVFDKTGNKVYFLSARNGSSELLAIQGLGAPRQIYELNLKNQELKQINFINGYKSIPKYNNILVANMNIFLTFTNKLYWVKNGQLNYEVAIDSSGQLGKPIDLDKTSYIEKMSFNEKKNLLSLSISCLGQTIHEPHILIFDLNNNQLSKIKNTNNDVLLGGWFEDKLYYISERVLCNYSIADSTIREVEHLRIDSLTISEIEVSNSKEFYFLGHKAKSATVNIYNFDLEENKLIQISNFPTNRSELRVFSKN